MQAMTLKTKKDFVLTAVLLGTLILCVTHMSLVREGVLSALSLCASALIPTLFPFLILTDLLLSVRSTEKVFLMLGKPLARLLKLSDAGVIVVLFGAFFGFPMGAKAIARYYSEGRLDKAEAERLLLFSGNASPFFLIGSVGVGLLSSFKAGVILYLLQLSVSLGCGILLSIGASKSKAKRYDLQTEKKAISFSRTVQGAVRQSLFISGYVVFFSSLFSVTRPFVSHPFLARLLASLLEIGNACAFAKNSGAFTLPFCAFSSCFSGLSVYFQTLDCIEGLGLDTKRYLPVKLLCGGVGFFLAQFFSFYR